MARSSTKGKSTIVWLLMGLLVLSLGGFGITSFTGGSSEIGRVGGTKVSANDYARALRSELAAYSQQTGQAFTMAQAQSIGLPQLIQSQLFTAATLEEQTRILGISVGDERVAEIIAKAEAFRGPNGQFDRTAYAETIRREGLSEAEFEEQVRTDEARTLLYGAVAGGVAVPRPLVNQTSKWLLELRDFSWHEITEAELTTPVAEPDEATLTAWHKANADRFTSPEIRKISYAWLTPEMLVDEVELDENALRNVYEQRISEFQQPERRLVGRLVFPNAEEAKSAKQRLDSGQISYEALVNERGLSLDEIDLGALSQAELGAAGDAVFSLQQPAVVGPLESDLGPALFSMNAILEPIDISFEQARADLRAEAALDRAARMIEDQTTEYEDILAGGATLEDLVKETPMKLGQLEWSDDVQAEGGSIAGYAAFRTRAAEVTESDFAEIGALDDGGIFALRLDEIVPPALIAFDQIRDKVAEDWRAQEVQRLLLARADDERMEAAVTNESKPDAEAKSEETEPAGTAQDGAAPDNAQPSTDGYVWHSETGLTRSDWSEELPAELTKKAFEIKEAGEVEVVVVDNRVFLVRLDAVNDADLNSEDALRILDGVRQRQKQSLQSDVFEYYARAVQRASKLEVDQSAINAINAQVQ